MAKALDGQARGSTAAASTRRGGSLPGGRAFSSRGAAERPPPREASVSSPHRTSGRTGTARTSAIVRDELAEEQKEDALSRPPEPQGEVTSPVFTGNLPLSAAQNLAASAEGSPAEDGALGSSAGTVPASLATLAVPNVGQTNAQPVPPQTAKVAQAAPNERTGTDGDSEAGVRSSESKPASADCKPPEPGNPHAKTASEAATGHNLSAETGLHSLPSEFQPVSDHDHGSNPNKSEDDDQGRFSPEAEPIPEADSAGTATAKVQVQMSYAEKMNKLAGNAEQFLPTGTFSADLTKGLAENKRRENLIEKVALNLHLPTTGAYDASQSLAAGSLTTEIPSATSTSAADIHPATRVAAKTLELVSDSALRLKHLNADSLSMVIKPDGQTELYLELRWRNGRIDARAELQHGDFGALNAHWKELQDKLGPQGIRLASLTQQAPSDWTGAHAQSNSRREPPPTPQETEPSLGSKRHAKSGHGPRLTPLPPPSRGGLELYA